jgi:hypothetical protein
MNEICIWLHRCCWDELALFLVVWCALPKSLELWAICWDIAQPILVILSSFGVKPLIGQIKLKKY